MMSFQWSLFSDMPPDLFFSIPFEKQYSMSTYILYIFTYIYLYQVKLHSLKIQYEGAERITQWAESMLYMQDAQV